MNLHFPETLFNPKFIKYLTEVNSSTEILFGGAGSSKTVHSAIKDVLRLLQGKNVLVVRQVYNTLQDSYYTDLKKAINDILDLSSEFTFKVSPLRIECSNKRVILFRGLDDVEKLKGIACEVGEIDHFTVEEATETKEPSINQLQFRSRGGGERLDASQIQDIRENFDKAKTLEELTSIERKKDIYELLGFECKEDFEESGKTMTLLFNPVSTNHWIYKRFFCDPDGNPTFFIQDKVKHTPQLYIMHSDHWDNAFLTYDDHMRYETYRFINQYFYNVYSRGMWGVLGNIVFENVKLAEFDEDFISNIPETFVGLDFGSKDPNALVRTGIDRAKKEIYILQEFVQGDMNIEALAEAVRSLTYQNETIWCDSANRQQISDLVYYGLKAVPVSKYGGANFKPHGISVLWGYTIYVSIECKQFAGEITSYTWKEDSHGNVLSVPDDGVGADHQNTLDAGLFYALNSVLIKSNTSKIYG